MVQGILKRIITKYEHEGLTPEDIVHLNTIKGQNPYRMLTLLLGLASFIFEPQYIIIPIVSLLLGFITYRTFDSETEKNPPKGFGGVFTWPKLYIIREMKISEKDIDILLAGLLQKIGLMLQSFYGTKGDLP
ncbi:hypothetical protein KEH51_04575 [[Brevibacterium] frigoritolerans]|uniref:Uncharacterized protein n=1 Tax=Peribacillus frigoritolerans TaxID=450367 RepID=A0A941FHP4_9BACI|nr:hypothetical protein [Peribacillus frigoritolerans]